MSVVCRTRPKFVIRQGKTFRPTVTILQEPDSDFDPDDPTKFPDPVNITGFDARMQIRTTLEAPTFIIELTVTNSGIQFITPTAGLLRFFIDDSTTEGFDPDDFTEPAVGELELIDTLGEVTAPFGVADFVLKEEVTR